MERHLVGLEDASDTAELNVYDDSLDRIRKLVEDRARLKEHEVARRSGTEQNFKVIRDKIRNSSHFLNNIKRDIENIKFLFQEDRKKTQDPNNADYLQYCDKTDEEIEEELQKVQGKLDDLQQRVSGTKERLNEDNKSFKDSFSENVKILENVGKGIFTAETDN